MRADKGPVKGEAVFKWVVHELTPVEEIANELDKDLMNGELEIDALKTWLASINPAEYRKRVMYQRAQSDPASYTDPEDHLRRALAAVDCAEAALRAAEARMHVLKSYRQAYPYPRGILGHITEAEEMIRSGRIAVSTVKDEIELIWDRNRRAIHDDVFK
ncbi:uncharacterized protein BO66DRAFT_475584 [Aspergillus aculeatinus CBS 121060]|uniref:Uncharacterized protein n=1 Tax=Aspergillus aculeatinus CBS 121060 TaxID=1448322 RepID=A0ACD1GTY1_9EURO|nr:hypothetical protein BO66DRAFT_475584 [Aspergillus aculeatinus CBS 121060]RAH64774.1 hypothetical protein BO66DRAFT_475584 [Aspergillus aculeatinus CBS 121060]